MFVDSLNLILFQRIYDSILHLLNLLMNHLNLLILPFYKRTNYNI